MNTLELKEKARVTIDELSNEVDLFKIKKDQLGNQYRNEWEKEIRALEDSKDSLYDIYDKISKANEESARELSRALDEETRSAERRLDHLREIHSKMLN